MPLRPFLECKHESTKPCPCSSMLTMTIEALSILGRPGRKAYSHQIVFVSSRNKSATRFPRSPSTLVPHSTNSTAYTKPFDITLSPTPKKNMSAMQKMQGIFNSRMEPIESHEDYPKYARSATKPVARARQIIDNGIISDHPCSTCVDLKQDCYRWEGTFSKCAYCTGKDKKKEFCHLPGQEALQQERRKRRKM